MNRNEVKYWLMTLLVLLLCSSPMAYGQTDSTVTRTKKEIVGTWLAPQGGNTKWIFSSDSTVKTYYNDKLMNQFSYSISRTPNHCGYDVSARLQRYPDESILTFRSTQVNKKQCALVYKLTNNRLILAAFHSPYIDTLKKMQQ